MLVKYYKQKCQNIILKGHLANSLYLGCIYHTVLTKWIFKRSLDHSKHLHWHMSFQFSNLIKVQYEVFHTFGKVVNVAHFTFLAQNMIMQIIQHRTFKICCNMPLYQSYTAFTSASLLFLCANWIFVLPFIFLIIVIID